MPTAEAVFERLRLREQVGALQGWSRKAGLNQAESLLTLR